MQAFSPISSVFKRKINKLKHFQSIMKMHNKFYISYTTQYTVHYFIFMLFAPDRHHNNRIIFAYIIIRMYKYACAPSFHSNRDEKQNLKYINNSIRLEVPNMKIQLNR